jgi:hypothetical protein
MKNLKVLVPFMLRGERVAVGDVLSPEAFGEDSADEWKNLLNMKQPRLELTDEKVGKASSRKGAAAPAAPAA